MQEDLQEFMILLLEAFDEELEFAKNTPRQPTKLFRWEYQSEIKCGRCKELDPWKTAVVSEIFLPLIVPQRSTPVHLQDIAFAHFLEDDNLLVTCSNCCDAEKEETTACRKKFIILTFPEALIVHLRRYGMDGTKVTTSVQIPQQLELPVPGATGTTQKYAILRQGRLPTIIRHQGETAKSGHYMAHIIGPNGWTTYDDVIVQPDRS
ncbi:hypothetical protein HDU88_007294 [Geranomyces variabilis]|nr:hypothetical protein HDU88_007294 [Geranomyces variabilis]